MRATALRAISVGKVLGEVGLELAVIGVNGGAQSGFSGASLAEKLQNALDIAHAVGVIDVGDSSQRFRVGHVGFNTGEIHEAAFEHVQRDIALSLEKKSELVTIAAQALGFEELRNAFIEPVRAAASGKLIDKRMSQFVLENSGQFGADRA